MPKFKDIERVAAALGFGDYRDLLPKPLSSCPALQNCASKNGEVQRNLTATMSKCNIQNVTNEPTIGFNDSIKGDG
jgi:hypothetical protein